MAVKKTEEQGEIVIHTVNTEVLDFCILGTTPMICNSMAQKAWHELLFPKGKKDATEKASSIKHDPIKEFRDSTYRTQDKTAPTEIAQLSTMFKRAMGSAALDTPGASKAQIGRLVYVEGELVPIFGTPRVFMAITRSADMNRTPDVRTRAILPEWACRLTVRFTKPMLRAQSIANLLASAGLHSGIGDWRQQKGSGSYGSFVLVDKDNADFKRIVATQGSKAQLQAFAEPVAYNDETSEMLGWFDVEVKRRGFKVAA